MSLSDPDDYIGNDYDPPDYEDCPDCVCCTRLGCHRGPNADCVTPDGDYLCPCTEG